MGSGNGKVDKTLKADYQRMKKVTKKVDLNKPTDDIDQEQKSLEQELQTDKKNLQMIQITDQNLRNFQERWI